MRSHCFAETAGLNLLREALNHSPDFSEWRDKPQRGDEDYGPAPAAAGQYLAAKLARLRRKKKGDISEDKERRNLVAMSVLASLAELEFLDHIAGLENEKRLRMRSSGRIVLVQHENDK